MTMAVPAAPCWQGGFSGAGRRSLPGIHAWFYPRRRHAKAPRLAPAGLGVLIWISWDWEGVISGFNGTLSVCSNCG